MGTKVRANPKFQAFDSAGLPLAGGKVYTYEVGTSTPKTTYQDPDKSASNANPTILDSRGEADIWWEGTYKVVLKDSNDNTIWTVDDYGEGEEAVVTGNYNLVLNGSFENGASLPDEWSIVEYAGSTNGLDSTAQTHGMNSMKFVSTGSGGGYIDSAFFEVAPAQVYEVAFALKSSVVDVRNVVQVVWYDENQAELSSTSVYDESAANPTSWTEYVYPATAVAGAYYAKCRVYGCHPSDATQGTTWYDNVEVRVNPAAATLTTTGDIIYASAANTPARLAVGASDEMLFVNSGVPDWQSIDDQTADTSPDVAADYLLSHDASAGAIKKVLMADMLLGASKIVIKQAQETVTSSTTLQDDDELVLTLAADTIYEFEALIILTKATSGPDARMHFLGADGTWTIGVDLLVDANNTYSAVFGDNENITYQVLSTSSGAGDVTYARCKGTIITGGTGGNFQFRWTANTSTANALRVEPNSFMKVTKIGTAV